MKVNWSLRARAELQGIADYIAQDSPIAARRWISELVRRTKRLIRFPSSGRVVPELRQDDIREVIVGNYRVIYQRADRSVVVLSVTEGHRKLRLPLS